jgi:hypothetical protein
MREVKVPLLFRDVPLPQVRGAGVSFRTTTPRETTLRASCEVVSVKLRTFVDDCSAGTSPASTPSPTAQAWRQPLFPSVSICGSPSPSDACANKNPQPLVRGTGGSHSNRRHRPTSPLTQYHRPRSASLSAILRPPSSIFSAVPRGHGHRRRIAPALLPHAVLTL